jgi:hypothetical protein
MLLGQLVVTAVDPQTAALGGSLMITTTDASTLPVAGSFDVTGRAYDRGGDLLRLALPTGGPILVVTVDASTGDRTAFEEATKSFVALADGTDLMLRCDVGREP